MMERYEKRKGKSMLNIHHVCLQLVGIVQPSSPRMPNPQAQSKPAHNALETLKHRRNPRLLAQPL